MLCSVAEHAVPGDLRVVEPRRSLRTDMLNHLRRQTDIALQLSAQMQTRAQVLASVITLTLSAFGLLVASGADVVAEIQAQQMEWQAASLLALLFLGLLLSLFVAFPRWIKFAKPDWYTDYLLDDYAAEMYDEDTYIKEAGGVLRLMDKVEIGWAKSVRDGAHLRGRLLTAAMIFVSGAMGLLAWIAINVVRAK